MLFPIGFFSNVPNSFCFAEASLWTSANHTPATFLLHRQHCVVYTEFRSPPRHRESFRCVPYIPADAHSHANLHLFSFYTRTELRSYRVASHVNTRTPQRGVPAAQHANANTITPAWKPNSSPVRSSTLKHQQNALKCKNHWISVTQLGHQPLGDDKM